MRKTKKHQDKHVLVSVLKSERDLGILLRAKWYRIPVAFAPKRRYTHIAFYQPANFGKSGKGINYFARAALVEVKKRLELLPEEHEHPNAELPYLKITFKKIQKLARPIKNVIPRRVSFGFTDLQTLKSARDILELYHVPPTEQIVERALKRLGISVVSQYRLRITSSSPPQVRRGAESSRRGGGVFFELKRGGVKVFRLDLAIFCKNGQIAIECDNQKAHSSKVQKAKDREKDACLKELGWHVIRLSEEDVTKHLDDSLTRIQAVVRKLGGQKDY